MLTNGSKRTASLTYRFSTTTYALFALKTRPQNLRAVEEEGPGILNWALKGLELANHDMDTIGTIALTAEQKQRVETLLDESEGLRLSIEQHIKADPLGDMTTQEIIEHYATFCAAPDREWHVNTKTIEKQLPDIMLQLFKTPTNKNIERNGQKLRGYRGIAYVP